MTAAIAIGVLLGVVSRIEETTPGFCIGVSSDATWLGVAFLVGVMRCRTGLARAAGAGIAAMTIANATYYGWIAATEPDTALTSVAGPPWHWFLLGISGGALFALTGRAWALSSGAIRMAWSLPLAGVAVVDGIGDATNLNGAAIATLGFAFPIASASPGHQRLTAGIVSAAIVAMALTFPVASVLP